MYISWTNRSSLFKDFAYFSHHGLVLYLYPIDCYFIFFLGATGVVTMLSFCLYGYPLFIP